MMYRVFSRNWWKANPGWPNGLEPNPCAKKHFINGRFTLSEAREQCKRLNAEHRTARQARLGYKWEFTCE